MSIFELGVTVRLRLVRIVQSARRSHLLLFAVALLALFMAGPAKADKRVALVVGNSTYKNVTQLDNPGNDAKLMAETLRNVGFALVGGRAQIDLDKV
jgi:caspase domain-containing protein